MNTSSIQELCFPPYSNTYIIALIGARGYVWIKHGHDNRVVKIIPSNDLLFSDQGHCCALIAFSDTS